VLSAAERRLWKNNEANTTVRMGDIAAMVPAITGKVELVYEGEQEGAQIVAQNLIGKAIRTLFLQYFPNPEKTKKEKANDIYRKLSQFFASGNTVELLNDLPDEKYKSILTNIPGLDEVIRGCTYGEVQSADLLFFKEFALHGLAETSVIAKKAMHSSVAFEDLLSSMINFNGLSDENLDIDDEEDQGNKPRW
jgi:magnesium chelatase subunit I